MSYIKRRLEESSPQRITCGTMRELTGYKDCEKVNVIHVTINDETVKHYHKTGIEAYYVLKGSIDLELDDKTEHCEAGTLVTILPGTRHKAKRTGSTPAEVLVISVPAWKREDEILVE